MFHLTCPLHALCVRVLCRVVSCRYRGIQIKSHNAVLPPDPQWLISHPMRVCQRRVVVLWEWRGGGGTKGEDGEAMW